MNPIRATMILATIAVIAVLAAFAGPEKTNYIARGADGSIIATDDVDSWLIATNAPDVTGWLIGDGVFTVSDDAIHELAKSGEICRVIGHVWVRDDSRLGYDPSAIGYRKCGICGTQQVQRVGAWE